MKTLSTLDAYFITKELQQLVGSKIDKVYQDKDNFLINFHITSKGKVMINITPSAIYLTNYRFEQEKPPQFCMLLRKYLSQGRVTAITQRGFERVIEFRIKKEAEYILLVELFSKGNIILCESDYTIIMPLHTQEWKDRVVKQRRTYIMPPARINPFEATENDFAEIKKDSIVKALAMDFGMGGIYAEEICLRSGIDKAKKEVSTDEAKKIIEVMHQIKDGQPMPNITESDVFPFELKLYESKGKKQFNTFSEALDFYEINQIKPIAKGASRKADKLKKALEEQTAHIEELKRAAEEKKQKADLIYKNYPAVKELIDTVLEARKKGYKTEEIAKRLKTRNINLVGNIAEMELD